LAFGETRLISMQVPWRDLKETEMQALRQRRRGRPFPATISRLRKLVAQCGEDQEADASICYHGSLALLFEFDRDWTKALQHRQLEIRKIRRLHKLEQQNSSGGYGTQNYLDKDLNERLEILEQIKSTEVTEPVAAPNRRPAHRRALRAPRRGGGR
jgi:hypothetical protein